MAPYPLQVSGQTIISLTPGVAIGQRTALSAGDIAGVRAPRCTYSVAPQSLFVGFEGGTVTTNVTAPPYCAWTTAVPAAVSVVSGASGTGTQRRRDFTITVAGQLVEIH